MLPKNALGAVGILMGAGVLLTANATVGQAAVCNCGGGYPYPNGPGLNTLTQAHSLGSSNLLIQSSDIAEMNGVAVEGVTLPKKSEQ